MNSDVIILAAGKSERMKTWKIELDFKGKNMIEIVVEKFEDICKNIIVVGGYNFDMLKKILNKKKINMVYNERYNEEMFLSVKKGVSFVESERFFIIPADCPFVRKETILNMLSLDEDIVVPFYNGKGGHPILMKKYLKIELLSEPDTSSLKEFIKRKGFKRIYVDDENILIDIDTLEDYERYKEIY